MKRVAVEFNTEETVDMTALTRPASMRPTSPTGTSSFTRIGYAKSGFSRLGKSLKATRPGKTTMKGSRIFEAVEAYRKAIALEPGARGVNLALGDLYFKQGLYRTAAPDRGAARQARDEERQDRGQARPAGG